MENINPNEGSIKINELEEATALEDVDYSIIDDGHTTRKIKAKDLGTKYTLPTASSSTLGGVKYPINATNIKDDTQNKTQAQLNALLCNKSTLFYWWGTYPKGHQSGVNTTTISVPMVNPLHKTYSIESVYVYDESGNFTQITNATIGGNYTNFIEINIPYVSSHAGKLIRIGLE